MVLFLKKIFIGNQCSYIDKKNIKESNEFMMMNTKEQRKKKDKDQAAILRETRNSMLDEQSEKPLHQDQSKRVH